jgi:chloride channel protein, CIC family
LVVAVAIFTGLGAGGFRALIGLVHNLFLLGQAWFGYHATGSRRRAPAAARYPRGGGRRLGVIFLVTTLRASGARPPRERVYDNEGVIRPVVAAVGREGPIIQIGASFGSAVAR